MFKNPLIMKKSKVYLLLVAFTIIGFGIGLAFDNLFTKSYANDRNTDAILPSENAMEVTATGTSRSADYEIVTIYGRKYIIFSNGDDIEVLNY
jgi:hypothetical protein